MTVDNISEVESTDSSMPSTEFLDLNKALIPQMLQKRFDKQFYLEQVHKPHYLKGSALFFDQPYLEVLTRTPWYVVPLVWIPIVNFHFLHAWHDFSVTSDGLSTLCVLIVIGVLIWTLLEYIFHRFLFHMEEYLPSHQHAYTLHFLLHGVHHYLPMDPLRLVLPPILFAFLSIGPYFVVRMLVGQMYLNPLYCGAVTAYIAYDLCHYFFHHGRSRFSVINRLKANHMAHHYKDHGSGFGVTSPLWDQVFGTAFERSKVKMKN